jgi:CRISPR-associated protein Cmr2
MTFHLHFTFGPVQGFVAQARRTRDLHAGSFLLSWLAYKAMDAVQSAGGTIILPDFAAIRNLIEVDKVKYGVAPNRFVASFDCKQQAEKAAGLACKGLQDEWRKIAEKVRERFVSSAEPWGNETEKIWQRQIDNFWEMAWGVGDEQDTALLDRRKNWRTPPMSVEGGDHCTLMGQYQELSGFVRSRELNKQNAFWEAIRTGVNPNLKGDERLCAIAMIKRFLPEVAREIIGYDLDAATWPSTVSIAALPWLKTIREKGKNDGTLYQKANAYADLMKNEPGALVSGNGAILMMQDYPAATGLFKTLSGNFLNRTALQNKKGTLLNDETRRKDYIQALRELEQASGDRAGNFYALLLMDGDNMGKLIRENNVTTVTKALTHFSAQVPGIVYEHNGITVYAGGDDLFALLPLDTTLDCAIKVSTSYKKTFSDSKISEAKTTISGAVIFAHYSIPLRQVIAQAHYFLDKVAKDQTGRDAIAIAVLKPGGETCRWARKFENFKPENQEENCFQPLIKNFTEEDRVDSLSSKYLYNLGQRFAALEEDAGSFGKDDLTDLFTAELVHGKISKKPAEAEKQRAGARDVIKKLVAVCYDDETKQLDFDGARLMRFLALGGKEGNDR